MSDLPMLHLTSEPEAIEYARVFRKSLREFSQLAARNNIHVTAYDERSLSPLALLPDPQQKLITENFDRYFKVTSQLSNDEIPLYDSQAFLWRMLRELDLRPCSDLFKKIAPNDVVEIYDLNFIQVFRNTRFMELCSYTLEEVFTHEFPQLFLRPDEITSILVSHCQEIFQGKIKSTIPTHVPDHTLTEIWSKKKREFSIKQGIISPLFDKSGRSVAIVATLQADLIKH